QLVDNRRRLLGLDEDVQEQRDVEAGARQIEIAQVAGADADVRQAGQARRRCGQELVVAVDERVGLRARRQELRDRTVAAAGIEDVAEIEEVDGGAGQRLPGAAGR